MRLRVTLADDLVDQLDYRIGRQHRGAFISKAVGIAPEDEHRRKAITADIECAVTDQLTAVERNGGTLTGTYPADYLTHLRAWPK
jgi:hypothetical protein